MGIDFLLSSVGTFLIFVFLLVFLILYWIFYKQTPSFPCNSLSDCPNPLPNTLCINSSCSTPLCSSNSDCPNNGTCISGNCYYPSCITTNDCPDSFSCINNYCIPVGSSCTSNHDCNSDLSCRNGKCSSCNSNSDCPLGQGCFNLTCRFPYNDDTSSGVVFFSSPANSNGNITAPPGYYCPFSSCGTQQQSCTSSSDCSSSCPFCVNSVCRCTPGDITESCSSHSDCSSTMCISNLCVPPGGQCLYNHNTTNPLSSSLVCPIYSPFCVDGLCSRSSIGSPCLSDETCNDSSSFCVNGICQPTPGNYNTLCTSNSCYVLDNNVFSCSDVPNSSGSTQKRCSPS